MWLTSWVFTAIIEEIFSVFIAILGSENYYNFPNLNEKLGNAGIAIYVQQDKNNCLKIMTWNRDHKKETRYNMLLSDENQ